MRFCRGFTPSFSWVLLGFGALGAGCNSGDAPKQQVVVDNGEFQKASCAYTLQEGNPVTANVLAAADIETLSFDKRIDLAPITAVKHASAEATVNYFDQLGVHVYKMPTPSSACTMFGTLDEAPADFAKYWTDASRQVNDSGQWSRSPQGLTLVGLYIEKNTPEVASSTVQAEIGLLESADRWTVVHEFMHHQFQTLETADEGSAAQLKTDFDAKTSALQDAVNAFNDEQSATNLQAVANAFVPANRDAREIMLRYPLEEVTIETHLLTHYAEFDFLPKMKFSSDLYISQSAGKAKDSLTKMASAGTAIIQANQQLGQSDASVQSTLQEVAANQALNAQIDATLAITGNAGTSLPATGLRSRTGSGAPASAGCRHGDEADVLLDHYAQVLSGLEKSLR